MAAIAAYKFHCDPVLFLRGNSGSGSYFDLAVRTAAARYVTELEAEAERKSNAAQNSQVKVPNWIG